MEKDQLKTLIKANEEALIETVEKGDLSCHQARPLKMIIDHHLEKLERAKLEVNLDERL